MKFEECHRLEDDAQRQHGRRGAVDRGVLGVEVPEVVREDYGEVVAFSAGAVALASVEVDVWERVVSELRRR